MRHLQRGAGGCRRLLLFSALLLLLSLLTVGCATQGPRVRTFVVEDGTQYFVRPMRFRGESGTALLDMTVRVTDAEESVSVNFSLPVDFATTGRPNRVDSAAFLDTTGKEYVLRELRRLYVDASVLRYESSMAYEELVQLVEAVTEEEERLVLRTVRGETVDEFAARSDFYESMKRLAISLE